VCLLCQKHSFIKKYLFAQDGGRWVVGLRFLFVAPPLLVFIIHDRPTQKQRNDSSQHQHSASASAAISSSCTEYDSLVTGHTVHVRRSSYQQTSSLSLYQNRISPQFLKPHYYGSVSS